MRNDHAFHLSLLLLALLQGCAGKIEESSNQSAGCLGAELGDQCIGATQGTMCNGETCVSGANCSKTYVVNPSDDIDAIAAAALVGECLALTTGTFNTVRLPSGVSLLGVGKAATLIDGIEVLGGDGTSLVRGMSVTTTGVFLNSGSNATVEQVEISSTSAMGTVKNIGAILVAEGATIDVRDSTILKSAGYGLLATDASSVSLTRSAITQTQNTGFWAQCTALCDCTSTPKVALDTVLLDHTAGLTLLAADATLETLSLKHTEWPAGQLAGSTAEGLVVANCSKLTGKNIVNTISVGTGLFVDQSSVSITGGTKKNPALNISQQSTGGIVLRDLDGSPGQQVTLEGFDIANNSLVGVSATFSSLGVRLSHGSISSTALAGVVIASGQSAEVGDGLVWADGSQLTLDDVDISSSGRVNFVLDGDAAPGSSLSQMTLTGAGSAGNALVQRTGTLPPGLSAMSPDVHPNESVITLWNALAAPSPP